MWSDTMNRFEPEARTRIMRLIIAFLGVVAVSVLIGLMAGRPFEAPASASRPTALVSSGAMASPAASATPRPTVTATPAPSPTPIPVSPTPDDGWLIQSRETFDKVSSWPAKAESGWASGYTDGRYWLRLSGQKTISYRIPIESTEFRIGVDVQVNNGYAGLVFLADEDGALYRYQIDNAGRYRVGRQQSGTITALIDWTEAAVLKRGADAVNQIEIRRVENDLTLFANNTQLATLPVPSGAQLKAQVGMTLDALARDRVAEGFFDNLVVRLPLVPSNS
jgi:hypothetical protein